MNSLYSTEQLQKQTDRQNMLKKLWGRHKEVARLHVLGFRNNEISELLGITTATVVNNLNSTLVKQELARLGALRDNGAIEIAKDIDELLPLALDTMREVMANGSKDSDKLKSAIRVLDMGGHSPIRKILTSNAVFDKDDLDEIKRRAKRDAPLTSNAIDVESVDVQDEDKGNNDYLNNVKTKGIVLCQDKQEL
ncbi:hypothetical protein LCGC14_3137120 [marine sediment metagenome]|uniref:HTH luxR-type domain-containing protein n=1 Tax=marine sediment metagenome TaxID=412755 RepID=A0A0F8Y501_9ZZZZ